PPASARPHVWWHWVNGNVTREGIEKDLAWLHSVGIGGVQQFDVSLGAPQVIERRLLYMSPQWRDAFRLAVERAAEKGLEFAIAASPGWSVTGGPWVAAQDGMKKLVWSEIDLVGGQRLVDRLPAPPQTTGPFLDLPFKDELHDIDGRAAMRSPQFYADVAVLAVPLPRDTRMPPPRMRTLAGAPLDVRALIDRSFETYVEIPRPNAAQRQGILIEFPRSVTIRSATIALLDAIVPFANPEWLPVLEARQENTWRRIATLPITLVSTTVRVPPTAAREFRVVFEPNEEPPRIGLDESAAGVAQRLPFGDSAARRSTLKIATLTLSAEPRIHRFEAKAGFVTVRDYYALDTPAAPDWPAVDPARVIDLTRRMRADGWLEWTPPPGHWRIVRLGYSLTGKTNHPAIPEATGLEVDKYDAAAVRRYLQTYLDQYRTILGDGLMGSRGLTALLVDSIEVGAANWTPALLDEFRRLRGYDPRPWLPALTGITVGSAAQSDAFLYDFRRTLAELLATAHYRTIAEVAHEYGLKVYGEALEDERPLLGDDLAMRRYADVPMAALWTWNRGSIPRPTLLGDMRGAASVAHVYGRNIVAAESLTSALAPWAHAPADLRRIVDLAFLYGINRPILHSSVHQPLDDRPPGLTLAIFGQFFNRHESWAPLARPWIEYLARCSWLLQQGRHVADVAYFYGEEQPLTSLYARAPLPDEPTAYAFDFVNAQMLADLKVANGDLVAPSGARYRVLYLGGTSQRMTVPTLRQIAALVESGATVIGRAPSSSPALADDPSEFADLVTRLWSGQPITVVGRGQVIVSSDLEATLRSLGLTPDFSYSGTTADASILFAHRRLSDGDLYFVSNRRARAETVRARFRVVGREPQLWYANTGRIEPASYRIAADHTEVVLRFEPEESYFVVFRNAAPAAARDIAVQQYAPLIDIGGAWSVSFQSGRGAPATAQLDALRGLHEHADPAVRYFSGIAVYSNRFEVTHSQLRRRPLLLDLGSVGDLAEVRINGQTAGTVWMAPYRLDVTPYLLSGTNTLEVRVANLWANRLIGDAQPGAQRIAFTTVPTYRPDAPLRPAGLIGPVRLLGVAATGRADPIATAAPPVVRTESGLLSGSARDGVLAFLGIPYAAPPVGEHRWRAPRPPPQWSGVRSAQRFGASCMQPYPPPRFGPYTAEFIEIPPVAEDCLFLNVWTQSTRGRRPVLVWIHGGAFLGGSGAVPIYDGANLAAQGAVVVTINYRVGPFGFLAHPELSAEHPQKISGNYGLLDQIAALRWVRRNIRAFGGDPRNVTIAGQSAGAASVHYLMLAPSARGLFHRAIAQSGSGMGIGTATLAEAEAVGRTLAEQLGAPNVAALRALPAERIQAAVKMPFEPSTSGAGTVVPRFRPLRDGVILPADPDDLVAPQRLPVPLLTGYTADEQHDTPASVETFVRWVRERYGAGAERLLELYPHRTDGDAAESARVLARDRYMTSLLMWSRGRLQRGGAPVYLYRFDHPIPVREPPSLGAFHTAEVPYVFGALDTSLRPYSDLDRQLSAQMQRYWLNFMRSGDPNGPGMPRWSRARYDRTTILSLAATIAELPAVSTPERFAALQEHLAYGGRLRMWR
ncbi:MAG: glycosyl hydrolase, partial [Steroidobacteraceae bacterium]|nr:glycosyl hydrolase [Steroidobacteraceae bacterium]